VKINSKKDVVDFIKRFAIPSKWCTVIDARSGKVFKVMKKGKYMQIPIQSLNIVHLQKFEFDFDGGCYKYHLTDDELDEIELVLEIGEMFEFPETTESLGTSKSLEKKRDQKHKDKKEVKGINVTAKIDKKKTKTATFTIIKDPMYSACLFKSVGGSTYEYTCSHCELRLIK
jgi:hypothetical protein